jgi:hypothetical protein
MTRLVALSLLSRERTNELVDYLRVTYGRNLYVDGEQMSSELKLVIGLTTLLVGLITSIYLTEHYTCDQIGYQDLQGTHQQWECKGV